MVRGVAGRGEALEPGDAVAGDVRRSPPARARARPRARRRRRRRAGARSRSSRRGSTRCGAPTSETQHLQPGVLADERARRAGVVEVDVREQQVRTSASSSPRSASPPSAPGCSVDGPAVEEREPVGRSRAGTPPIVRAAPRVEQVDRLAAATDCYLACAAAGTSAASRSAIEVVDRLDPDREADEVRAARRTARRRSRRASSAPGARSGSRRRRATRRAGRASCVATSSTAVLLASRRGTRPSRRSRASAAPRSRGRGATGRPG